MTRTTNNDHPLNVAAHLANDFAAAKAEKRSER